MLACVALAVLALPADDPVELKAVVAKALKAANADKLRATRVWMLTETVTYAGEHGFTALRAEWGELPDRYRLLHFVVRRNGGTSSDLYVVNGEKGWAKKDGTVAEMSAREVAARKQFQGTAGFRQALALDRPDAELKLLPPRTVGVRAASAVAVSGMGVPGSAAVLVFDRESGRLLQRETKLNGTPGDRLQRVNYLDVREVGGIPFAHRLTTDNAGEVWETVRHSISFPETLDPKLFEKPE